MKLILIAKDILTKVDDEDFDHLSQFGWFASKQGKGCCVTTTLPRSNGNQKSLLMHRVVMNAKSGQIVKHLNGNGLDNQKSNLFFYNRDQEKRKCYACNATKKLNFFHKTSEKNHGGHAYKCKSCVKSYQKKYVSKNREKINKKHSAYKKEWYLKHANRLRKNQIERRKNEPMYKLKCRLRSRIFSAFKRRNYVKNGTTELMLGVPYEIVKKHIERKFKKDMTWNNYGKWQIDHVIPLISANTEQELEKLCHYTNLQPLWAFDNIGKGSKITPGQIKLTL